MATIRETMNRTGLSYDAIHDRIADGRIKATLIGNTYDIPEEEIFKLPKPRPRRVQPQSNGEKVEVPQGNPFPLEAIAIGPTSVQLLREIYGVKR